AGAVDRALTSIEYHLEEVSELINGGQGHWFDRFMGEISVDAHERRDQYLDIRPEHQDEKRQAAQKILSSSRSLIEGLENLHLRITTDMRPKDGRFAEPVESKLEELERLASRAKLYS
ncbi:MAG: hypothetical protein ACPG4N_13740, partial [Gammaproteobacteria bacterium]